MTVDLPEKTRARIEAIRSDNTSGAVRLTRDAAAVLSNLTEEAEFVSASRFRSLLIETGRALADAQPTMAPLFNLVNTVLLDAEPTRDPVEMRNRVAAAASGFVNKLELAGQRVREYASGLIADGTTVMTHSYSETVLNTLVSTFQSGRRIRLICTESRPMREGVTLASKLGKEGIPVTLIVDAAMLSQLPEVHIILVGADAVSSRGLVNKTGTSMLGLGANKMKKEMYALCGSEKFLPARNQLRNEPLKNPKEVMDEEIPNVTPVNFYFDVTPLAWLAGVVCEEGILTPADLKARLVRMKVHKALRFTDPERL